jgi:hypothetical protein
MPRWLVSVAPGGRLDSYDALTGRRLATAAEPTPAGPLTKALAESDNGLFLAGGNTYGATAYALPALTTRWHLPAGQVEFSGTWIGSDCGPVLCAFRPKLVAIDPATGRTRWASDRWTYAQRAGNYLVASDTDGAPDLVPLTVLDPATGQVRAGLGGWRQVFGPAGALSYVVHPGHPSLLGRFDAARMAVRIAGTTDQDFGHCDGGAGGAVVCHLTAGPVAIWRL